MTMISSLQVNSSCSTALPLTTHVKSCSNAFNVYTTMLANCLKQDNALLYNKKRKSLPRTKDLSLEIPSVLHQKMFESGWTQREDGTSMVDRTIPLHHKHSRLRE